MKSVSKKVLVMSDTNSGIRVKEGERFGITIIPMPFIIDGVEYLEGVSLSDNEFFEMHKKGANITTSQPSIHSLTSKWEELLKIGDEVVYIPMSSGLSGSFQNAYIAASSYNGKVQVVDNHRISCTQKQSVLEALALANQGKSAIEIKRCLEACAYDASIYITVDTLEHLKKGGRITATGAAIGTALHVKPILQIQGEKLDAYGVGHGKKAAQKKMIEAVKKDVQTRFKGCEVIIKGAYTGDKSMAEEWKKTLEINFPNHEISLDPLSLNIACHIGYGATAVVCMKKERETLSYEMGGDL